MALGIAVVVAGIIIVLVGEELTQSAIRSSFGSVKPETVRASPVQGVVPAWTTCMVLFGWLLMLIGVAIGLVSPL